MDMGSRIVISAFLGICINSTFCYIFEAVYHLIRKHCMKNERAEITYCLLIILHILISAVCGIYTNGRIR